MTRLPLLLLGPGLLMSCVEQRMAEDPSSWYQGTLEFDVTEPVEFTDQPYAFPAEGAVGIEVLNSEVLDFSFGTVVSSESLEGTSPNECEWDTTDDLPIEIEGMVTLHPRHYFKTDGCTNDDEKYYGSDFIEDATGGIFVLGDSKVAHFDMGDRVKMRVRGARRSWDLNMVYVHEILEVERVSEPIYYQPLDNLLTLSDIGEVRRVTGTVKSKPDTFGQFWVEMDGQEGQCQPDSEYGTGCVGVSLDVELNRRGVSYPVGTRLEATGPVLYSYQIYTIVVIRVGQITVLD